jgi:hypothetical protein
LIRSASYIFVGGNPVQFIDPDGLRFRAYRVTSPNQATAAFQVRVLEDQIRMYDPTFAYQTMRPTYGPASRYNTRDVRALMQFLSNAKNAGYCGPGASAAPNILTNGTTSMSQIQAIVPSGTPN